MPAKNTTKHVPTDEKRKIVKDYLSFGMTQESAARAIGVSHDTLLRHYKHEIDTAREEKVVIIADSLFQKAKNGDVTAQIFFLKTQGRWRTEDKTPTEQNEEVKKQIKDLRASLDSQFKKDF